MGNRPPLPDVEKSLDAAPVSLTPHSADGNEVNAKDSNNNVRNKTSSPAITQNVAQAEIVDWEGDDDPAKPMNW
jgi:hypothetical protein